MNTVKKEVKTIEKPQNMKLLPTPKAAEPTEEIKKDSAMATIEKFVSKTPPTAEERIERILHFEAHSKRFRLLKEKSNDLKMFDAGNDKTNAKIVLKNSAGFEFDVRNSNVIDKVTKTMREELNILLTEAENEVLNFEI